MNLKQRSVLTLDEFLGADLSSSAFDVDKHRAVESYNFINENGINKKRNGWIEKVNFENTKINGIYSINLNSENIFLVHAGKNFFRVTLGENSVDSRYECISQGLDIADAKSVGFVNKDALYLLCGNYLVFSKVDGEYKLREVRNDENTYTPITTIGIEDIAVTEQSRTTFEPSNMLNDKRINKAKGKETGITIQLDAMAIEEKRVVVEINTSDSDNNLVTHHLVNDIELDKFFLNENQVGSIDFEKGQISLTLDSHIPSKETDLSDNIAITFYKTNEEYKKISGCTFGITFGTDAGGNRLFISGNKEYKNLDWFSGYSEGGDYTYFTSTSVCAYGSDSVKNVAYTRLGDGTLAMHKAQTSNEPSIYYRTFGLEKSQDNSSLNIPIAPITAGNIGVGAISAFASVNLNGDNIILTNTGLYGIVLAQNVATNERVARERSRYINARVLKTTPEDLEDAVMYALNGYLYLKLGNKCYVANSRYKSRLKDDYSDTFNYEFWVWDNIPARVFSEHEGKLVFGTHNGKVCFFDTKYVDRSFIKIEEGDIGFLNNNTLIFSSSADYLGTLKNGDYINIKSNNERTMAVVVSEDEIKGVTENRIQTTEDALNRIYNGLLVEVGGKTFTIREKDRGELSFLLEGDPIETVAAIKTDITNTTLKIIDYNQLESSFKVAFKHLNEPIEVEPFTNVYGYININQNVRCSWLSPIFDLGSNIATKKLQSLTLTSEAKIGGKVNFGYKTAKSDVSMAAKGISLFDFGKIDFTNFSFESKGFPTSYSVRTLARDFNYIQFSFDSENDGDCAIHSINVEFSILRKYKGVK